MLEEDKIAIEEAKAALGNIRRPLKISHYLYVPHKDQAETLGKRVSESGFSIVVSPGALGNDWLVLASKKQLLDERTISELREFFSELAESVAGGEYDGWEVDLGEEEPRV